MINVMYKLCVVALEIVKLWLITEESSCTCSGQYLDPVLVQGTGISSYDSYSHEVTNQGKAATILSHFSTFLPQWFDVINIYHAHKMIGDTLKIE